MFKKNIEINKFKNININDPFFDSLKNSCQEFENWFAKKSDDEAYLMKDEEGLIQAFLYIKEEKGEVGDVKPPLPKDQYLKVGTFKINPHGTKLGERFIKKIFDNALSKGIKKIYVTIFPDHQELIQLLEKFGFEKYGHKKTKNGVEDVLLKQIDKISNEVELDYPIINLNRKQYLIGIYPAYHTRLFPDSILHNEDAKIIDDVSHTNSIQKIYICRMKNVEYLKRGDALVIYRTKDEKGSAWYRSVATSLCVVQEVKNKHEFDSLDHFLEYCLPLSVFSEQELKEYYKTWGKLVTIKMTYNAALHNRIIMKQLVEKIGLNRDDYWGFRSITEDQFRHIAKLGGVDESFIVN